MLLYVCIWPAMCSVEVISGESHLTKRVEVKWPTREFESFSIFFFGSRMDTDDSV